MKTVPLHGEKAAGRVALVDDEDYALAMQYRWNIQESSGNRSPYAIANVYRDGKETTLKLHQLVTGWALTDHVNHDGLDNQRHNLRPATHAQNAQNRRPQELCSSQYKGVSWNKREACWWAYISADGHRRHLGKFTSEVDAARAYDTAARIAWGEYACLNLPDLPPLEPAMPRPCAECGGFIPPQMRSDARYCSPACRRAVTTRSWTERRRERRASRD